MKKSEHLDLWLPEDTDPVKVSDLSENFETLDAETGELKSRLSDLSGLVAFRHDSYSGVSHTFTFPGIVRVYFVTKSYEKYVVVDSEAGIGGVTRWDTVHVSRNELQIPSEETRTISLSVDVPTNGRRPYLAVSAFYTPDSAGGEADAV